MCSLRHTIPLEERLSGVVDVLNPNFWMHRFDQPGSPLEWRDFTNPDNDFRIVDFVESPTSETPSTPPVLSKELYCYIFKKLLINSYPEQNINLHINICWSCHRYWCSDCSNIMDLSKLKADTTPSVLFLVSYSFKLIINIIGILPSL
jgi:hypothetical protein